MEFINSKISLGQIFKAKYVKDRHVSLIDASKGSLFWKRIIVVFVEVKG